MKRTEKLILKHERLEKECDSILGVLNQMRAEAERLNYCARYKRAEGIRQPNQRYGQRYTEEIKRAARDCNTEPRPSAFIRHVDELEKALGHLEIKLKRTK